MMKTFLTKVFQTIKIVFLEIIPCLSSYGINDIKTLWKNDLKAWYVKLFGTIWIFIFECVPIFFHSTAWNDIKKIWSDG